MSEPASEAQFSLGDRVRILGTVEKVHTVEGENTLVTAYKEVPGAPWDYGDPRPEGALTQTASMAPRPHASREAPREGRRGGIAVHAPIMPCMLATRQHPPRRAPWLLSAPDLPNDKAPR